ncbi:helix-turn-helix domain-containing protein [Endozoicomonas sp. 8E]|uniref:helix-turn-helix domain-containing protein n=1 Tax=Endozoicomonas sp. 8E TaxID=3035692 RepID=UPI002938DE1E|nr:helix-turn-helix domain-containing protein [Endozoicomonas sp. 8E]WOG29223.1 helix-turn-helix domain-containing protein [Endozoicomonas sp. 8E]
MLRGIRLKANPTDQQKLVLSQWMGCARVIWNAKCDELCGHCGHVDNADRNASIVIKNRAINLFSDSGTELVGKGIPVLTKGRRANRKSREGKPSPASGREASKKKGTASILVGA